MKKTSNKTLSKKEPTSFNEQIEKNFGEKLRENSKQMGYQFLFTALSENGVDSHTIARGSIYFIASSLVAEACKDSFVKDAVLMAAGMLKEYVPNRMEEELRELKNAIL